MFNPRVVTIMKKDMSKTILSATTVKYGSVMLLVVREIVSCANYRKFINLSFIYNNVLSPKCPEVLHELLKQNIVTDYHKTGHLLC